MIVQQPNLFLFAQEYCLINSLELPDFWWKIIDDISQSKELPAIISVSREMGKTIFNNILAEYDKYHVEPFVSFYTMGFLSKWGFNDGDKLDEVEELDDWVEYNWNYHDPNDTNNEIQNRFFLAYLLIKYVCPLIGGAQFTLIGTHHNPMRINTYKGQDIDHYGNEDYSDTLVKPEEVQVSVEMIKRDFLTFYQPNKNIWSEMVEQIGKLNSRSATPRKNPRDN